jgi:hypothetical protein
MGDMEKFGEWYLEHLKDNERRQALILTIQQREQAIALLLRVRNHGLTDDVREDVAAFLEEVGE